MKRYSLSPAFDFVAEGNSTLLLNHLNGRQLSLTDPALIELLMDPALGCAAGGVDALELKRSLGVARFIALRDVNVLISSMQNLLTDTILLKEGPFPKKHLNRIESNTSSILGIPYGQGNTISRGCAKTPVEFRKWLPHTMPQKSVVDYGNILFFTGIDLSCFFEAITDVIYKLIQKSATPIIVGGDHSITYPIIRGFKDYRKNPLTLLIFDAHCDIGDRRLNRTLSSWGGGCSHANFLYWVEGLDFVERICVLGVRDRADLQVGGKIECYSPAETTQQLVEAIVRSSSSLYLSIDVDVLDPKIFPATATPIPGGFTFETFSSFLMQIMKSEKVCGVDLVECNTERTGNEAIAPLFAQLFQEILI